MHHFYWLIMDLEHCKTTRNLIFGVRTKILIITFCCYFWFNFKVYEEIENVPTIPLIMHISILTKMEIEHYKTHCAKYKSLSIKQQNFYFKCISQAMLSKREVPRDVQNSKVRRQDKFRRDWSRHKNTCKSQSGTGPGVWRSKYPLLACRTRCIICSMETLHN